MDHFSNYINTIQRNEMLHKFMQALDWHIESDIRNEQEYNANCLLHTIPH